MANKYYIILQPSIRSMGGEEMYTRNIIISAKEHGYIPVVFHSGIGDKIYIEDLKPFDHYSFSLFRYEPCVISSRRKARLLKRILYLLPDIDGESIIESHEILVAEWGELLAAQLKIRHLAYMLLEHNEISYKPLYDFFKFKYDCHELVGITPETVPDMLRNFDINVTGYYLPAYCNNVTEDIPCPDEFRLGKADYTIGSIGRTNKKYVQPMIDSLIRFVTEYKDKLFNILYVGGSMDKSSERLVMKRLSSLPNVKLVFTGMLFPLSIEMLRQMDVCIASSGSCNTARRCGIPTISIDGNDSMAIGLFRDTTNNSLFRDSSEPPIEIEDLLKKVLIDKKFMLSDEIEIAEVDFASHWDFIRGMKQNSSYFDIKKINYSFKMKCMSVFLGYYYGLKADTIRYKLIKRLIGLLKKN